MNDMLSLPPAADYNVAPGSPGGAQTPDNPFEIFHKVHRLLRGRYWIALSVGAVGAIAGAIIGYKATVPKYQAMGMIRIRAPQTLVYQLNDQQIHQGSVRSVQQLLQEPRVIDRAMQSDEWKSLGRGLSDDAREEFKESLRVDTDPGANEWIYPKFTDVSPRAARIGVAAVIAAYGDLHGDDDNFITPTLLNQLQAKVKSYENAVSNLQSQINQIADKFGTSDLSALHKASLDELRDLDQACSRLEDRIKQAETTGTAEQQEPATDLDAQAALIAKSDETIRGLVGRASDAQAYLDHLLALGFTEAHPSVVKQRATIAGVQTQLRTATQKWLAKNGGVADPVDGAVPRMTPEQLQLAKTALDQLSTRRKAAQERTRQYNEAETTIADLMEQKKKQQQIQSDHERRLNQLTTESGKAEGASARVQLVSEGEEPRRPYSDNRKKLAAFGFLLGGGFPFCVVLLWGLLDRRFRYSDDAVGGPVQPTLLGILPFLPDNMADPEQAAVAAHCVHQIRTLLQISGAQQGRRVFAVTSPTSGDGKTSLSMSLALSFASSGANTCVIDFDLIGGGLTSAMNAKTENGIMSAIEHGELNGQIRPTGFKRLSIVPSGRHDAALVATLSPENVRRLISEARERFDVVVIDTGPILGSLEASLVTSASDGVILTLGRGQARMLADRAVKHLTSVGATLMGVVFNRAQPGDFRRAMTSASVRSVPNQAGYPMPRSLPAMGPMASVVAGQVGPTENQP